MPRLLIGNIKGTKGDTGAQGERGLAGTIEVGSVQTVGYGSPASVTNSGTEEEAILDFQIPQGAPGATVTDMKNLVLGAITDSTADYPAFAVNETGSTIFGKIRKFLSDLKANYVSKTMMTTSTIIDTEGQAVADAKAIKSLNDSLANLSTDVSTNYATKTELANSLSDLVKMQWVVATIPANETVARNVSATIPSGYKWLGWNRAMSTGWVGYIYPAGGNRTTDFWTDSSATTSDRSFTAYYLVIKDIS